MTNRRFRFWSALELREAILALEQGYSSGAASVSTSAPGGGSVTWTSRDNYLAIIADMNDAYDQLALGIVNDKPAITRIRQISKRGW